LQSPDERTDLKTVVPRQSAADTITPEYARAVPGMRTKAEKGIRELTNTNASFGGMEDSGRLVYCV